MKHASLNREMPQLPPRLLHSACVPSEGDKVLVDQAIGETQSVLSDIDAQILQLQASLADLALRREDAQTHLLKAHAVLSPIRRLPPEILEEIFLQATMGSTMSWPPSASCDGDYSPNEIPWRLGAVCSWWRTIILSLANVWSTVHLDLSFHCLPSGRTPSDISQSVHNFLDTCLRRSGSAPLSLSLTYTSDATELQDDSVRDVVCSVLIPIVEVSRRWRNLNLDLEDLFSFHSLLFPAVNRVSNLETLSLASPGHSFTTPRPWHAIDAFCNAPRLRQLTLIHIPHPTLHLRLPWGQLTHLRSRGSHFHEGEFIKLLRSADSLQEFTTEDERVLDMAANQLSLSSAPTNGVVHLPHLHTLAVINKGSYISRIFQLITAPSLTNLSIHSRTAYSADHAISMLRRSGSTFQLRSLTLESSRDPEVVWEENYGIVCLLAEVKRVETLVLRVSKASDEIIPRLTVKRGMGGNPQGASAVMAYVNLGHSSNSQWVKQGTILLPNLKRFSLEDSFCASAGELREMLHSRISVSSASSDDAGDSANGVSLLREVRLKLSRPAPPTYAELEDVKVLAQEKGVNVEITT